jgi:molybdenum cofactor biosynthesis enzyme MoaA
MVTFNCRATQNAVTVLPNGEIAPCCVIKGNYSKPISFITDKKRFSDLQTEEVPKNCSQCVRYPEVSYKNFFDRFNGDDIQYLDFRNSNLCNLKCRTCGPHFSSSWAKELNYEHPVIQTDVFEQVKKILDKNIKNIYFAGGEPFLNKDHWQLLELLIRLNYAANITLYYSTNLTITTFKSLDAYSLWKNFKEVQVMVSVDAIGEPFNYIRSGANWDLVDKNINTLLKQKNIHVILSFTLSAISVWFLPDVLEYANQKRIKVNIIQLTDPHYFTLNVFPTELVEQCIDVLNQCKKISPVNSDEIDLAISIAKNNDDQRSFLTLVSNVLLADKIRSESLFDFLPFQQIAIQKMFEHQ